MSRIQLYRPSNGTEGMIFQDRWCDRCRRGQGGDGCMIVVRAFAFEIDDEHYPTEWQYVDGVPTCTAFVDATIPVIRTKHKPCRDQLPLFDEVDDWSTVLIAADNLDENGKPKEAARIRELANVRNPKAVKLAKRLKPEFFAPETP